MFKNTIFWRSVYAAWTLACDRMLPAALRPAENFRGEDGLEELNPLYFMPLWGAFGGLLALIAGSVLSAVLPLNGTAIVFALFIVICSELRTGGRALALNVTFFDKLFDSNNLLQARMQRVSTLKNCSGLIPLLLAIGWLGGKFFAVMLVARSGHFGVTALALTAALSAEAFMAAEPAAAGVPKYCSKARSEYIAALTGFLLLFNLIFLPLATLIAAAAAGVITITALFIALKRFNSIDSNDMTATGGLVEVAVWIVVAILIG